MSLTTFAEELKKKKKNSEVLILAENSTIVFKDGCHKSIQPHF